MRLPSFQNAVFLQKNSWMILNSKHPKGDILFTKDLVITSLLFCFCWNFMEIAYEFFFIVLEEWFPIIMYSLQEK